MLLWMIFKIQFRRKFLQIFVDKFSQIHKLRWNKIVKRFLENFNNDNRNCVIDISLHFRQHVKLISEIFHCNYMKSKNYFHNLINTFILIVRLKMINDKIHQFDIKFFENNNSYVEKKFSISIWYDDFR